MVQPPPGTRTPAPPMPPERPAPFRLRMKVIELEGKLWLVPQGIWAAPNEIQVHVMREDDTRPVKLTLDEWDALPFYWFECMGEGEHRKEKWPLG